MKKTELIGFLVGFVVFVTAIVVMGSGLPKGGGGGGGGGDTHPITDATPIVAGSADATKLVRVEADGITTGTTRVITMPDQDIDLTPGTDFSAAGAIANVVEDTTPQLGGDLDMNTNELTDTDGTVNVGGADNFLVEGLVDVEGDADGLIAIRLTHSGGSALINLYNEAQSLVGQISHDTSANEIVVASVSTDGLSLRGGSGSGVKISSDGDTTAELSCAADASDCTLTVPLQFDEIAADAPAEPYACADGVVGAVVYVDDTNDTAEGYLCLCTDTDDGTTFDWRKVSDTTAACAF